jgi:beta-lactam-binding protein with PASTA domain/serine/threonine protein kinase
LIELLGEGSFGKVYKARRQLLEKTNYSAIKIIRIPQNESQINTERSSGASDEEIRDYFYEIVQDWQSEIEMLESLKSAPNIMVVEDYEIIEHEDKIQWDIYIRMELLTPFTKRIQTSSFKTTDALKLGIDLCRALEYCSARNIIHRDIKPENIFVSSFGDYKLGDFGIARQLEKTNSSLSKKGTYMYMAPEVYRGDQYDASVDIYSLGLVLYKLFNNNRFPFAPQNKSILSFSEREESLGRRIRGDVLPPPIHASELVSKVILKACAFNPSERYRNPSEMIQDLQRIAVLSEQSMELISAAKSESDITQGMLSDKNRSQTTSSGDASLRSNEDQTQGIFQSLGTQERTGNKVHSQNKVSEIRITNETSLKSNEDLTQGIFQSLGTQERTGNRAQTQAQSVKHHPQELKEESIESKVDVAQGVIQGLEAQDKTGDKTQEPVVKSKLHPQSNLKPDSNVGRNIYKEKLVKPDLSEPKRKNKGLAWIGLFTILLLTGALFITQGFGLFNPSNQEVEVPNVVMIHHEEATNQLKSLGLKVIIIEKEDASQPEGTVLEQSISQQNKVLKGSSIQLTVAKAIEQVTIPRVVGLDINEAKTQLENLGLVVTIKQTIDDKKTLGEIISQSIPADSKIDKGSSVELTSIVHSAKVTVPNLIGKTENQAKDSLASLGLNYKVIYEINDNQTEGLVFKQSALANSLISVGLTIDITVYKHSALITVPGFSGKTLTTYKNDAEALGFKVVSQESFSDTVAAGQIISVSPTVGTKAKVGSTITVTVSKGKLVETVKVPTGVGSSFTTFQTNATNVGLIVSKTDKCSNTVASGSIISMNPAAGTTVNKGSTVNVIVSTGMCPWSDWVTVLPSGVSATTHDIETKTQYQFRDKETTTASTPTLSGWIKYNEVVTGYGSWSAWQSSVLTESSTINVESREIREYFRYYWKTLQGPNKIITSFKKYDSWATPTFYERIRVPSSLYSTISYGGALEGFHWVTISFNTGTTLYRHQGSSVDPFYTSTVIKTAEYTNALNTDYTYVPSNSWFSRTSTGTYIIEYRSRPKIYTYYFYRWGSWSAWQDTTVASNSDREVQTRTVYRYRSK